MSNAFAISAAVSNFGIVPLTILLIAPWEMGFFIRFSKSCCFIFRSARITLRRLLSIKSPRTYFYPRLVESFGESREHLPKNKNPPQRCFRIRGMTGASGFEMIVPKYFQFYNQRTSHNCTGTIWPFSSRSFLLSERSGFPA